MSALIINFRFRLFFVFHFCYYDHMAEPVVVMAEPLESASDRDAASYRDALYRNVSIRIPSRPQIAVSEFI